MTTLSISSGNQIRLKIRMKEWEKVTLLVSFLIFYHTHILACSNKMFLLMEYISKIF